MTRLIRRFPRFALYATLAALLTLVLTACQQEASKPAKGALKPSQAPSSAPPAPEPVLLAVETGEDPQRVPVDTQIRVTTSNGTLSSVQVKSPKGRLEGALDENGAWVASGRLEPGRTYTVTATATRAEDGVTEHPRTTFQTEDLTLDQQTYASIAPMQGETVGVGMPVIVKFDVPVRDHATFEEHMTVTAKPVQEGTWHWISDTEAHYRPRVYWKAGSTVTVDLDINSVPAGRGIYGQESRHIVFRVGDAHIYKVSAVTHQMRVYSNGKLLRTIPITTGKAGFTTRSGIKVIVEKFASKRMNSETVGIPSSSPDAYDIDNVEWAMRITFSGEFIHAAPWSVGSQGYANVSHGCTGMSTSNAEWLYSMSRRGDVAEYVGTDRPMTMTNGYGDWNMPWRAYQKGSALGADN